jgi:hypothetical protein
MDNDNVLKEIGIASAEVLYAGPENAQSKQEALRKINDPK